MGKTVIFPLILISKERMVVGSKLGVLYQGSGERGHGHSEPKLLMGNHSSDIEEQESD